MLDKLSELIVSGGFVMPPLMVGCAVLWFALAWRLQTLRRGNNLSVTAIYEKPEKEPTSIFSSFAAKVTKSRVQEGEVILSEAYEAFSSGGSLITTVVMISPLLGLLGTVSGMIETFESLGDMTLFSQSGGIAGGISQALVSTQMGLAVAIPGLIMGRLLGRKQNALLVDLEQLVELHKSKQSEQSYA